MTATPAGPFTPPAGMEPDAPPAAVRGERWFRRVDDALAWADGWIGRWLPPEFNPLAQAGAAASVALLVAVATGILMLLWYSPSLTSAYPSLAAIPAGTIGGWVRMLHRYSSDLAMLLLAVHAARVFFARKFGGARSLAWVSGVGLLALVWFIGWTGYWLVWDQPAQQIAVASIRLLDGLPIFGEPLGRLFVSERTVPSLLFFVVFFLHVLFPLGIAAGLVLHLARVNRARLLPGWWLSAALVVALGIAAAAVPAPLEAPARMTVKAAAFSVDAWYLTPLAFGLRFQHAGLWVALGGSGVLGALVPWLLGRRRAPETYQAIGDASRCHACTQCVQDCPFDAIAMVARTDGKRFPARAQVDPARCVGCGVCAGSCDSNGIGLGWFDTRIEESRIQREIESALARHHSPWAALVAREIGPPLPVLPGFEVHRVPTAAWVRPGFVERLLAAGMRGVLVVRDARTEAWARDGGRWVEARLAGNRKPVFRPERTGSGSGKWRVVDFDPSRPEDLKAEAEAFRRGAPGRPPPSFVPAFAAGLAVLALVLATAVLPSHVAVKNPMPSDPELVLSLKAFGDRRSEATADPAEEAAKPVHMRGVSTANPRRADVMVTLAIDGLAERRTFVAKGFSHDGPAIGEWRREWPAGEHHVVVEIANGSAGPVVRWEGTMHAVERRINVIVYTANEGFAVE